MLILKAANLSCILFYAKFSVVQKLTCYISCTSLIKNKCVQHFAQNVFTESMEHGDRQRAMKRLRVPPLGEQVC